MHFAVAHRMLPGKLAGGPTRFRRLPVELGCFAASQLGGRHFEYGSERFIGENNLLFLIDYQYTLGQSIESRFNVGRNDGGWIELAKCAPQIQEEQHKPD